MAPSNFCKFYAPSAAHELLIVCNMFSFQVVTAKVLSIGVSGEVSSQVICHLGAPPTITSNSSSNNIITTLWWVLTMRLRTCYHQWYVCVRTCAHVCVCVRAFVCSVCMLMCMLMCMGACVLCLCWWVGGCMCVYVG